MMCFTPNADHARQQIAIAGELKAASAIQCSGWLIVNSSAVESVPSHAAMRASPAQTRAV
jgi:hypothetical protein